MTDREKLIETRKEIILEKMAGATEAEKARAIRNIDRMDFDSHADFMSYVDELTDNPSFKASSEHATEEEMKKAFPDMYSDAKSPEASKSEFEQAFKNFKI